MVLLTQKGKLVFKLVKGKNGSTPFLPMTDKTGGKVNYIKNREAMCLTERQVDHVYNVIDKGGMINTKTMTCERDLVQNDNAYKKVILNNVFKEKDESPEMRNWSIFSDNVRYIQHDQVTPQNLNIDALDYREHKELYLKLKEKKGEPLDVDFGLYPDNTKSRYLDAYEDVYAEMVLPTNLMKIPI